MNKKEHLINSLRTAVNALKNDIVTYNWSKQSCCNAGIVSQAVLGLSERELDLLRKPLFSNLEKFNRDLDDGYAKIQLTWKNAIKDTCPLTGKNMPKIIQELEAAGLTREDIAHLEYLENPAILKASGIKKIKRVLRRELINTVKEQVEVKKWFGLRTVTEIKETPVYQEIYEEVYPKEYYAEKENLILYLSAWIRILTESAEQAFENTFESDRDRLEAELLNAVAEENYERAAEIRNQLSII
jgi:hypothetical protein